MPGETAQRREFAREAGHRVIGAAQRMNPLRHLFAAHRAPVGHASFREGNAAPLIEIALVPAAGVVGKSAFEREKPDEVVDVGREGRRRFAQLAALEVGPRLMVSTQEAERPEEQIYLQPALISRRQRACSRSVKPREQAR